MLLSTWKPSVIIISWKPIFFMLHWQRGDDRIIQFIQCDYYNTTCIIYYAMFIGIEHCLSLCLVCGFESSSYFHFHSHFFFRRMCRNISLNWLNCIIHDEEVLSTHIEYVKIWMFLFILYEGKKWCPFSLCLLFYIWLMLLFIVPHYKSWWCFQNF